MNMNKRLSRRERREQVIKWVLIALLIPLAGLALYGLYFWSLTYSGF